MCIQPCNGSHCEGARHHADVSNEGPMSEVCDVTENSVIPEPPSDQDKSFNNDNIKVIYQPSVAYRTSSSEQALVCVNCVSTDIKPVGCICSVAYVR